MQEVVEAMEAAGEEVTRDPFGHVQIDEINPGAWIAKQFAELLGADKVLVQKSGYFSRRPPRTTRTSPSSSAAPTTPSTRRCAAGGGSGRGRGARRRAGAIEFDRIKGGKTFDTSTPWFVDLLEDLGRPWPMAGLHDLGRRGRCSGTLSAMLRLRISSPSALTGDVLELLSDSPAISSLSVMRGASLRPEGDIISADVAREAAAVIDGLRERRVHTEGSVHIDRCGHGSPSGYDAERLAPGSSADSVVWADVTQRAYEESSSTGPTCRSWASRP